MLQEEIPGLLVFIEPCLLARALHGCRWPAGCLDLETLIQPRGREETRETERGWREREVGEPAGSGPGGGGKVQGCL